LAAVTAVAPGAASTSRASSAPPCAGSSLTGSFAAVPGSAGAGQISYNLGLRNRSARDCFVSGLPGLRLLDRYGKPLPTHVTASHSGALTAVRVLLRPGTYSAATARFSPDVPGVGEPVAGRRCERAAYHLRVLAPPSGSALVVPVLPVTSVCEHGSMRLSVLVAGRNGPDHA
jgi:hypothetical protein